MFDDILGKRDELKELKKPYPSEKNQKDPSPYPGGSPKTPLGLMEPDEDDEPELELDLDFNLDEDDPDEDDCCKSDGCDDCDCDGVGCLDEDVWSTN
jgi:hypothetical protein